jgi:hypothetical protein
MGFDLQVSTLNTMLICFQNLNKSSVLQYGSKTHDIMLNLDFCKLCFKRILNLLTECSRNKFFQESEKVSHIKGID